jgi:beta-glucosidase
LRPCQNPYSPPPIPYTPEELEQIANEAELAIITIGRNAGEGGDRVEKDDFLLTESEQELITNACNAFQNQDKRVIVVLNIGGVIETASWSEKPDAIVLAWQGGQEGGNSVADVISGQVNPSGKLPMTFPIKVDDHAAHRNFPLEGAPVDLTKMIFGSEKPEAEWVRNTDYTAYEEGVYVGYRHFDKSGIAVSYPFGYGLSYADFEFSDLSLDVSNDTLNVLVKIQNVGQVSGKEVAQVYVSKVSSGIDRPVQELKAFAKTDELEPEAIEQLTFQINIEDFSYWDESTNKWVIEPGSYEIRLGNSSRDIKLTQLITL